MIKINIPYIPAKKPPPPFLSFWWSKVWGGAYTMNIKRRQFFSESKFWHDFRGCCSWFLFEEVSEPEEMTDDDSTFSPWELKIEFISRKFIQLTLIELLFSFIFLKCVSKNFGRLKRVILYSRRSLLSFHFSIRFNILFAIHLFNTIRSLSTIGMNLTKVSI